MASQRTSGRTAETAIAAAGVGLVLAALAARQAWLDRHLLPSFMISRQWYVAIETAVRAAFGTGGALLIVLARPVAARLTARHFVRALQIVIAIVLALVASELVLQRVRLRPAEWRAEHEEPRRRPDARLGWIFEPARTAYA